jgi:hypothetical protein
MARYRSLNTRSYLVSMYCYDTYVNNALCCAAIELRTMSWLSGNSSNDTWEPSLYGFFSASGNIMLLTARAAFTNVEV